MYKPLASEQDAIKVFGLNRRAYTSIRPVLFKSKGSNESYNMSS